MPYSSKEKRLAADRAKCRIHPRNSLHAKLGITREKFYALLEAQGWCCAICRRLPKRGQKLVVDHCHRTAKFRGMLCIQCNTALGKFNDDPAMLRRAIKYLRGAI